MGRILFEDAHHRSHHQDFSHKGLHPKIKRKKGKLFLKANDLCKAKNIVEQN